jgi:L-glutamine:2-deoxy-scyllo-inosose/3-amino-2,3-dideoxy-scyllo-inosose aminotransferase
MSKLALLGDQAVCDFKADIQAVQTGNPQMEREKLLEAYDSGIWDDWQGVDSQASRFAKAFAQFQTASFCSMVTNGTHAMQLALEALDIGYGDEVIVPGITWQATASAVCDVNAVPVLVDVDAETFCIDADKIEAAITPRTRAIMPVHLYARMADMDKILAVAARHNLQVIEDCAHAHGNLWDGRGAGSLGVAGTFSFQRSKSMNGGEGGAILTNDATIYRRLESMRNCGRPVEGVAMHNGNYRLTSFQAGILLGQLEWLKRTAGQIDAFGREMDKAVDSAPGAHSLRRSEHITRQCGFAVDFRYDKKAFGGLSAGTFRKALSAETGLAWSSCYEPLNNSSLYYPHTRKRYHISKQHLRKITPSRWKLPVARKVYEDIAVVAEWRLATIPVEKLSGLTDAIEKIYDSRKELIVAEKTGQLPPAK